MCAARRFQVTGGASGSRVERWEGRWVSPVYAVAGSLAPLAKTSDEAYRKRLDEACRQRADMDMWFSAPPERAYLAARLTDAVVAAAQQPGILPFRLTCTPYPPDARSRPQCAAGVRKTSASLNPRAIVEVGECPDTPGPDCVRVQLAKVPKRSPKIEDRWTLDITFDRGAPLGIEGVALSDTQLIID